MMHRPYSRPPARIPATIALFLAFGIGPCAFAQAAPSSTNSVPDQNKVQPNPAPGPGAEKFVLQSQVPLVVVDVSVVDAQGHPVRGLEASAFIVHEKGARMKVDSFEEHRSDQALSVSPEPVHQNLGPNTFTNVTDTPNNGPLNVLLLDALNTPASDQMYVRQQMLKYIKHLPQGTCIAIFGLANHLFILQSFTTDSTLLQAALNGKSALPAESALLNGPTLVQIHANIQQFVQEASNDQTTIRIQSTLSAMNALGRYLSGLKGRKNLIWFSGSFPFNFTPDQDESHSSSTPDVVKSTADLMRRSQVAVYPVDARTLLTNPAFDSSVASTGDDPPADVSANIGFFTTNADQHDAMDMMAEQTGGKAFYSTSGLQTALRNAIDQGSNYYTLTYTPTNRQFDGGYRSLRVKVDQPGESLFYRHGYYAMAPNAPVEAGKGPPASEMQSAMQRGGPDPTQISLKVKIAAAADLDSTLPRANRPNEKKMKPPYRHYTVWYIPDLKNLSFTPTPDGIYHGSLEFVTVLYSPAGEMMNSVASTANLKLPAAKYQEMMSTGLQLYQYIDAPEKGEFFLRLGVHDVNTGLVGAVEVPLSAVQQETATLPPPPAQK